MRRLAAPLQFLCLTLERYVGYVREGSLAWGMVSSVGTGFEGWRSSYQLILKGTAF
jgi:hypothetical protein